MYTPILRSKLPEAQHSNRSEFQSLNQFDIRFHSPLPEKCQFLYLKSVLYLKVLMNLIYSSAETVA